MKKNLRNKIAALCQASYPYSREAYIASWMDRRGGQ